MTVTGGDGTFRFDAVPQGVAHLVVRRLGFRPESLTVDVPQVDGGRVVVFLERSAQLLPPVRVSERRVLGPLPSAFERRRSAGFGRFITRAEIDRQKPLRTTDLLRSIPGVTLGGPDGSRAPRFRSAGAAGSCEPSYFVNGLPTGGGLDLDAMSPQHIEAIEVYSGAATMPAALRSAGAPGGCGAIVIWNRTGDVADPLADVFGSDSLEQRLASGWALTSDQVELAAALLPGLDPHPAYPDSLYRAGVGGRVTVEFVVDEQGRVDPETVGIVSSTHPLFAASVRSALPRVRFAPAYAKGRVVRQFVQLPVVFGPASEPGRGAAPKP